MEPITIGVAMGLGVLWRKLSDRDPRLRRVKIAKQDREADRVLPAGWAQLSEIDDLAHVVAARDNRDPEHVLCQYKVYTYAGGTIGTMIRRNLTRTEAARIIKRIRKGERVDLDAVDPDTEAKREEFRKRGPLDPRDDEEAF